MTKPSQRRDVPGAALLAMLAWAAGAAASTDDVNRAAALRASQAAVGRVPGDREFIDHEGRSVRLRDLRGRPLVLSLVYTSCYSVCSGSTLHLRDVVGIAREALGPGSFSVLTVGFDSENDSPERMYAYGRERGIDDAGWRLVSAVARTIRRLTDEVWFT